MRNLEKISDFFVNWLCNELVREQALSQKKYQNEPPIRKATNAIQAKRSEYIKNAGNNPNLPFRTFKMLHSFSFWIFNCTSFSLSSSAISSSKPQKNRYVFGMFYVHFSKRTYQNTQELAEIDMWAYKSVFVIKKYWDLAPCRNNKTK